MAHILLFKNISYKKLLKQAFKLTSKVLDFFSGYFLSVCFLVPTFSFYCFLTVLSSFSWTMRQKQNYHERFLAFDLCNSPVSEFHRSHPPGRKAGPLPASPHLTEASSAFWCESLPTRRGFPFSSTYMQVHTHTCIHIHICIHACACTHTRPAWELTDNSVQLVFLQVPERCLCSPIMKTPSASIQTPIQ